MTPSPSPGRAFGPPNLSPPAPAHKSILESLPGEEREEEAHATAGGFAGDGVGGLWLAHYPLIVGTGALDVSVRGAAGSFVFIRSPGQDEGCAGGP